MTRAFWTRVDMSAGPDGCWPWLGTRKEDGRGRLIIDGHFVYAYRHAWELDHGSKIAPGLIACHACDNPSCVNPAHIFIGTHLDNMRDAVQKGRTRNRPIFGIAHHNAVHSDAVVREAREAYAQGVYSQPELAEMLAMSQAGISHWLRGDVRAAAGGPIVTTKGVMPVRKRTACGTRAGYQWHRRHAQDPCDSCITASREYHARRRIGADAIEMAS